MRWRRLFQSTHPVRGATSAAAANYEGYTISIHAPRAGCDIDKMIEKMEVKNFNPRTPCGVRRAERIRRYYREKISIHAPRAGCDRRRAAHLIPVRHFNPRTPCGVRPDRKPDVANQLSISIHAPRAGCDYKRQQRKFPRCDFNPRTPCGVRPASMAAMPAPLKFQSTHPVRGATTFLGACPVF